VNLFVAAENFAILTNTIVFQNVYHETHVRFALLQKFCAVNIKIIWPQCIFYPFNAFRNIFHLKEHLANATEVTYCQLFFYYVFIYFHPNVLATQFRLAFFSMMLWRSPQKLTFDRNG
jgi:hypothetical protein